MAWEFNADDVEPSQGYNPLPAGEYEFVVVEQTIKLSKSGSNYLSVVYEVVEPAEYSGRKHFENLNLWHHNPEVVEIAQRSLSALCRASGVRKIADLDLGAPELEGVSFPAKVTMQQRKDAQKKPIPGEFENRVLPILPQADASTARQTQNGGAAPSSRPAAPARKAPPARPAPAAGKKAPWAA